MSISLIKIYRTPTTTNERLPTEQQNGYHGVATEQLIEGDVSHIFNFYCYFFSFLSASLEHSVLSVEPNINDVYRFHKAAKLGRYERWITLLNNQVGASRDPVTIVQDKPQVNLP